ncbi:MULTISPECIES: hypothetical protein [unclassified Kitasatospora]|uniref:hypothetical protein n=1 Tax=unclassified Kitasatospora TaxID=2633591 RepID=UPI001AE039C5|nr:hypothetical protein [Kitasatospora sp. RG8]MBP0448841.1 hypothetical protein [Kitasatospora sp. RG8]
MSAQAIRLPQFLLPALDENEAPRVMTDSAAERAWVPAYAAVPTYASVDRPVLVTASA